MGEGSSVATRRVSRQRWRMGFLVGVHVYIVFHMLAWYVFDWDIWGKTAMVGVLSLLGGRLNAAAVMILIILASILFYGRFFCGWFCHLRGSLELADWTMRKLRLPGYRKLRDRNVLLNTRYRWFFRGATLFVLLIPVLAYWASGGFHVDLDPEPLPPMADVPGYDGKLFAESAPVNAELRFAVPDFLLGFGALLLILFVMSFVLNYYYGQGAFCRLLCPYGVIFVGLMNRSPWQKKITRVADCTGCRKCSRNCPQGIDVSREIFHHGGKVTNLECIKCYHCIDACGHGVLADSRRPAAPQITPRREYVKQPWAGPEKHLQQTEPLSPALDFLSVIFGLLSGAIASVLGGFWFYVGAILGFIVFRKLVSQADPVNSPRTSARAGSTS